MSFVTDSRRDRVDPNTQLVTEHRSQASEHFDIDMRSGASFDTDHLGMRDPGRHRHAPTAEAGGHAGVVELVANAVEKPSSSSSSPLGHRLSGRHAQTVPRTPSRGLNPDFTGAWNLTCYEPRLKPSSLVVCHITCYERRQNSPFGRSQAPVVTREFTVGSG